MVSGLYPSGLQDKSVSKIFLFSFCSLRNWKLILIFSWTLHIEMNTMPSTAPTSADACLSIVHSLMCHRVCEIGNFVYFCIIFTIFCCFFHVNLARGRIGRICEASHRVTGKKAKRKTRRTWLAHHRNNNKWCSSKQMRHHPEDARWAFAGSWS